MADKREKPEFYAFPAIFEVDEDDGGIINVSFPDLPNCFSNGHTVEEAMNEGKEALENVLYWMEHDGNSIAAPSDIRTVEVDGSQFKSLIVADMAAARRAWENRSVNRTLTLPAWLDELARKNNVNFSQVLQQALKGQLAVTQNTKYA